MVIEVFFFIMDVFQLINEGIRISPFATPNGIMGLGSVHQRLLNVIKSIFPITDLREKKNRTEEHVKCHEGNAINKI